MNKDRLSDVIEIISGGTPKTSVNEYWNGNINWLSVVDFGNKNKYVDTSEKTITELGVKESSTKVLDIGDIIISARGTVGAMAVLKKRMAFNQSCFGLRAKKDILNQDYLYYFLKNHINNIRKRTQGSVFETINLNTFNLIDIYYPDMILQNKIAKILSNLDDKIENNFKIISEIEEIVKTIYDYWFLQYEFPNEEGKPYKSNGGKMKYNEVLKKEIPLGWKIENIINNSISSVIMPGIVKFDGKKNYLATANINNSNIQDGEWITYNNRESRANMQPVLNSVWFAKMKNSIKHITFTKGSNTLIDKYILSTGFLGIKCKETSLPYIYCFIYSENFEKQKDILAHGATQEAVNNKDLENIKIQIPEDSILSQFSNYVYDYLEMQNILIQENQELTNLRDYLLPLLMNGQVSFKN